MRRELLAQARGRVLELGAGTGAQPRALPGGGREPGPRRARPAHDQAAAGEAGEAGHERRGSVRSARRNDLPFEDDSFDTAVGHPGPLHGPRPGGGAGRDQARPQARRQAALRRARPLRRTPGSPSGRTASRRPWRFLGDGCHCNRDTVAAIGAAGLTLDGVDRSALPKAPPMVRPLVAGTAHKG